LWLNSQWSSAAASADADAPVSQANAGRAPVGGSPAPQGEASNAQTGADDPNAADEAPASPAGVEPTHVDARTPSRTKSEDEEADAETTAVGTIRATAREKKSAEDDGRGHAGHTAEPRSEFGRGQGGPCRLSTSAGALTIRRGGGASVTLSLGGAGGEVTASTPDWSNIVVLSESVPFRNEAQRYSVRSVSGRPGVYSVRFRSPCGSRTIPVTVTGIQK
ncbi:MAG TPA: hypothetical protein VLJ61_06775, partial [Pyrinomonadaceae bacterium]|nr:hypothetical protein [Pyrinomonadaceae bacterium]